VLLVVAVVALVVRTIDVLLVILLAVLPRRLSPRPSPTPLHRRSVPEPVGLLVGLAISGRTVGVFVLIAPAVYEQVRDLLANLPQFLTELDATISKLIRGTPLLAACWGRDDLALGAC